MPSEQVDVFIAQWRERAALMTTKPGFLDSRLHRALSFQTRFQLANVSQWESRQAYQAATADTEFQERIRAVMDDLQVPVSAYPALYHVAGELSGPVPDQHNGTSYPADLDSW